MTDYDLTGKTVAVLATNGFEDDELTKPLEAVKAAGAEVLILSEKTGNITGENGTEIAVDHAVEDVNAEGFDGLLLPGGVGNPDQLRLNSSAVAFVKDFVDQHKLVAAICHAPWMLIEAGVVDGRTVTSWPSLKTDLQNAGAIWVDEEVVVDQGLITSRNPDDIPAFNAKIIESLANGIQ